MKNTLSCHLFILLIACCMLAAFAARAQCASCSQLNELSNSIRDGAISKTAALKKLQELLPQAAAAWLRNGGNATDTQLHFPLQGYNKKAVGGRNGSGYLASGYDYFAGNRHGGHPAHDIFIADKDQDGLDDATGKPVNVLSATYGIVIAAEKNWLPGSTLRGGNYIWIYSPATRSLFYYAHNSRVLVTPGAIVKAGQVIATVGRTGFNASKKRSPTHLHFMRLRLDNNCYPHPADTYAALVTAK